MSADVDAVQEALEEFRRLLDRLDYEQAADLYEVPVEALAALAAAEAQRDELILQNEACGNALVDTEAQRDMLAKALDHYAHNYTGAAGKHARDVLAALAAAPAAAAATEAKP